MFKGKLFHERIIRIHFHFPFINFTIRHIQFIAENRLPHILVILKIPEKISILNSDFTVSNRN